MRRLCSSLALALLGSALPAGAADKVDFNYDIQPILSSKCFHCHGPDEKSREAKLRLDIREEALKERDGIRAIVPGDLAASDLVERIMSKDKDEVMPPPKEGHPLEPREIELLKRWIAQGAEYKAHWSFVKPVRAAVPEVRSQKPEVRGQKPDVANPIDAFIHARLAKAGLAMSPEADRHTLIRRMSFDLIGLPPTPAEVDAFVADSIRDPQSAIRNLADRLLASPAYGERWARLWLDLARYADSTGYGSDKFRLNIWPYRDWVIGAFNRNLPYDRFTTEQLAGDLLPDATPEQMAATAFHRNTMTNVEGGSIDEEWRVAAVKDRIATTGQVWMGLTVGCAQCHTHKFDPIPHKEYYSLFAVFNQTEDNDREDEAPTMPMPTADEQARREKLQADIAALEAQMNSGSAELEEEQHVWEGQMARKVEWRALHVVEAMAGEGRKIDTLSDGSLIVRGPDAAAENYVVRAQAPAQPVSALRLEALPDASLPGKGPGRAANGNAVVSEVRVSLAPAVPKPVRGRFVRVELPGNEKMLALAEVQVFQAGANVAAKGRAAQSSTDFGSPAQLANDGNTEGDFFKGKSVTHTRKEKNPWWEVAFAEDQDIDAITIWNRTDGDVGSRLADFKVTILDAARKPLWEKTVASAPKPNAQFPVPGARDLGLRNASADFSQTGFDAARAIDGDERTGWAFGTGTGRPHAAVFELREPVSAKPGDVFVVTLVQAHGDQHTLGRFRLSATAAPTPVRELPPSIMTTLALEPTERTPQQREELAKYYRPLSQQFAALSKQIEGKKAELAKVVSVKLPVLRERPAGKQRETFVMNKGNYLSPGEKVQPGLFSVFAEAIPQGAPMNRLAAAQWILSPENPLTARVAVNRFWAQLFGIGIVETEEDFGSQGALPTHPELLDWLAVAFSSPKANSATQPSIAPPASAPALSREASALNTQLSMGWDVKALLKLMVTSATYRQSSHVTPELLQQDPRNRLLAHFPRRRLDAEAVRDQALALSGLLSRKIGGPSVYPPQPAGLWNVAFNGGQNAYPTSQGEDAHRRGLYTFWRRTMPYPSMTTFDAPSRETSTVRRIPTNTPLQAFVTMNDPVFVEASQALAQRIVKEGGADTAARIRWALKLALARPADPKQAAALQSLYDAELANYRANAEAAKKLAGPLPPGADAAELAAWTVVANVLLNLDGVLMKS